MCGLCGGHFTFLDHLTEQFIKHMDEVFCPLCPMKFSHINLLALHLKNAHPKYHIFCKSCSMGQHLPKQQTADTDKTPVTPKMTLLVEEVKIENEEVEIAFVKEEEEEIVVVGKMEEMEETITETPEDNKTVNRSLHDHNYFSTQACSSIRETKKNVVLYTSNDNVLVYINKTDPEISPKDTYTESDQQGTPDDDQTTCKTIHDHSYFSFKSLADKATVPKECSSLCKTTNNVIHSSAENTHVFDNKAGTKQDTESTESDQEQEKKNESSDHTYFSRQSLANHKVLSKQVLSAENILSNQNHGNNVAMIQETQETTQCSSIAMLESSQPEHKIKVKENLCEIEPVQEDAGIGECIQRHDHEDSDNLIIDDLVYTSQDDWCSDTVSCTSKGTDDDKDCKSKSWSACQKQNDKNTDQNSLSSVGSKNSNPAESLYKDLQICACCGFSKVPNTVDSMAQCTCTQAFTCSLCGILFGTEQMLLTHQAEKHPLAKYLCVNCLQLFPNQKTFIQHVCSKSKGFSGKSLTPSNVSDSSKELLLKIVNVVPSPANVESLEQPLSCHRVNTINKPQNLGTVLNSKAHSLPSSPSTSATQKAPVQVIATSSTSCTQKNSVTCCISNGDQGQVMIPISTGTEKQIGQVQVLSLVQAKKVTQTFSNTTATTTQILLSLQRQGQLTPISTKSGQIQNLTPLQTKLLPHTLTRSSDLTTNVLPQQQRTSGVHLPHPFLHQVSSSVSIPSQTDQLLKSSVPCLDIGSYSPSTQIRPSSAGPLKIVAMYVNQSKELALQKRMRQSWRSKAVFPCRQCGAVSRQFSLGVRHRYQHCGPRHHRCQCGRTFHQRMHLLRHQVQHAEATRYVCAACGHMFCGTKQLACHKPLFRIAQSNRKKRASKECRNMFQCYCGHSFTRPAALLWHLLKNSKARKPRLKGLQYITVKID